MYDKKDVLKINLSQVAQSLGIILDDRAGYYTASCPYHNDTHSSFIIYDNLKKPIQGIWQCFTCGIQGDSIDLVMKDKKLSFSESVDWIGETFDLQKQNMTPEQKQMFALKAKITPVLISANDWFVEQKNEWFYEYLEARKFDTYTITAWDFGYAPNNVIDLKRHLYDQGFDDEALVGSGLFKNKASGVEPVFYGRLMIPIKDKTGNIVGFAGRAQSEYEVAKYITTTAQFTKKRRVAYGLDRVRKEDNVNTLYLLEGNLDTPKFMQNTDGFAVSVMGASITKEHIKEVCASLPDLSTIIIALDGDDAGRNATQKFINTVYADEEFHYKNKIDFFVFDMPDGMDMDTLVTEDLDKFYELRKKVQHVITYTMRNLRSQFDETNVTKNEKYAIKCLRLIASVADFRTKYFLEELSKLSGFDIERLNKELSVYKVEQRNINRDLYEKKLLRFVVDNKEDTLEELGVPIIRILSERGRNIFNGEFAKYSTKLLYMNVLEQEEVTRDESILYGLLLLASNYYEIVIEYDGLLPDSRLRINKNTNNQIMEIRKVYDKTMRDAVRRIDV